MKRLLCICSFTCFLLSLAAQTPDYITNHYDYTVTKDISYGSDTAYDGKLTELFLDLYKPVGDNNCKRPVIVLIHGGAWIGGDKAEGQIPAVAAQFAAKGWVVASINYRLGMHTAKGYTQYLLCPTDNPALCAHVCDSSEIFRAIYRGMQDTRGAIRFLKLRAESDSTDVANVHVAGESAGAFLAMYTAYLNRDEEKPSECYELPDAPTSAPAFNFCHKAPKSLARPDLGSIHGSLHLGEANDSVQGVACFYGAMHDLSIMDDNLMPTYIFHQASDVIVYYKRSRLLNRLSDCLSSICQPYYNMPLMSGGFLIKKHLSDLGTSAPPYKADILENSTAFDCTINPPGHGIDNIPLRTKNIAELFAPIVQTNGNNPADNCQTTHITTYSSTHLRIFPNPGTGEFILSTPDEMEVTINMTDVLGRQTNIITNKISNNAYKVIFMENAHPGIYNCNIISPNNKWSTTYIYNNY